MQFIYHDDSHYDIVIEALRLGGSMEWIKQIFVTGIITELVLHLLPDKKYDKYVRLICGVILTMICISPILSFLNGKMNIKDYINVFEKIGQKYDYKTMIKNMEGSDQAYYIKNYIDENTKYINELVLDAGFHPVDCDIILELDDDSENYGSIKKIILTIADGKNACYETNQSGVRQYSQTFLALVETISDVYEIEEHMISVKFARKE